MIHVALALVLGSYFVLLLWCRKQGNAVTSVTGYWLALLVKHAHSARLALMPVMKHAVEVLADFQAAMDKIRALS